MVDVRKGRKSRPKGLEGTAYKTESVGEPGIKTAWGRAPIGRNALHAGTDLSTITWWSAPVDTLLSSVVDEEKIRVAL